jgi:hypothetical protein
MNQRNILFFICGYLVRYGGRGDIMKRKKWESAQENNSTYLMYYNRLRDYALSLFEWTGLPDSINERFLEIKMLEEGKVVFFEDENLGYLTLPVMYGQTLNVYQEPTHYTAFTTGYSKQLTPDEGVIIWNNLSRTSFLSTIRAYAKRLYQVERTMDVNIQAQKTPVLILADESQRLTLMNAYMQYDGNEPFIFGNKSGFDTDSFQVLKTDAPFVSDKLMAYKHNLWNEAMTFLGIGNAKQDKKERLVSDEVSANDEQIFSSREVMLVARQQACEKINKMFGLNVSVDFKLNKEKEEEPEPLKEVSE